MLMSPDCTAVINVFTTSVALTRSSSFINKYPDLTFYTKKGIIMWQVPLKDRCPLKRAEARAPVQVLLPLLFSEQISSRQCLSKGSYHLGEDHAGGRAHG